MSTSRLVIAATLFIATNLIATQSQAQNLYRCGSAYQDKPCENGQGKIIGKMRSSSDADKPVLEPACARRGQDAQKILWMREGGALQDKLMAEAGNEERRQLIADIYAVRGNSSDIRTAIEKTCMEEKERERQFGIRPAQAESRQRDGKSIGYAGGNSAKQESSRTNTAASRQRALCELLKKELNSVRKQQRSGGNVSDMEQLHQQKRESASTMKSLGCDEATGAIE